MQVVETELVALLERTEYHRYVYVSADIYNLDTVSREVLCSVDLDQRSSLVYLVRIEGIEMLSGAFDGIYVDEDTYDPSLKRWLKPGAFLKLVNPKDRMVFRTLVSHLECVK